MLQRFAAPLLDDARCNERLSMIPPKFAVPFYVLILVAIFICVFGIMKRTHNHKWKKVKQKLKESRTGVQAVETRQGKGTGAHPRSSI